MLCRDVTADCTLFLSLERQAMIPGDAARLVSFLVARVASHEPEHAYRCGCGETVFEQKL